MNVVCHRLLAFSIVTVSVHAVEPLNNGHHWESKVCPLERCPQLRGFRYIFGRRGMRNRAVEHNVASFSELSLCCTLAGLVLQITVLI